MLFVSSLWWISASENFLFSKNANVEPFTKEGETYFANVTDEGNVLACITVRLEPEVNDSGWYPFHLTISPYGSEFDLLTLEFDSGWSFDISVNSSSFTYTRSNYRHVQILDSGDLGHNGTNALNLTALLQPGHIISESTSWIIFIKVKLSMHRIAFMELTRLTAETTLSFSGEF